jgi:hypothetical protein
MLVIRRDLRLADNLAKSLLSQQQSWSFVPECKKQRPSLELDR